MLVPQATFCTLGFLQSIIMKLLLILPIAPVTALAQQPGRSMPDSFSIIQQPYTITIQPDPIRYQRMPQQQQPTLPQQQSEWIWVPQRAGLFGWHRRWVLMRRF
jgi:hypothetical protein